MKKQRRKWMLFPLVLALFLALAAPAWAAEPAAAEAALEADAIASSSETEPEEAEPEPSEADEELFSASSDAGREDSDTESGTQNADEESLSGKGADTESEKGKNSGSSNSGSGKKESSAQTKKSKNETKKKSKKSSESSSQEKTSSSQSASGAGSAEQDSSFPPAGADGVCGERVSWTLKNHVLTISGTGEMYDYVGSKNGDASQLPPWSSLLEETEVGIQSVVVEEGVTGIGDFAFFLELDLTEVSLPSTLRSIGTSAFGWTGLSSVTLPEGLTSIGEGAFLLCSSLREVAIPDSVTEIGADAFSCCGALRTVTLGETLETIGRGAFEDCPELTSITIPASVTSIGDQAFGYYTDESDDEFKTVQMTNFSVVGAVGSAAQTYAQDNGFLFRSDQNGTWPLSTPSLRSVSASGGNVTLRWRRVSGAEWYRVYRRTSSSGWKAVGETTSVRYTDETAASGTVYYYTVRCISGQGGACLSDYDRTGLSTGNDKSFSVRVVCTEEGIQLRWSAFSGAEYYEVYRNTGSGFRLMAAVSDTGYLDSYTKTDGRSYSYRVCPCSGGNSLYTSSARSICWEKD